MDDTLYQEIQNLEEYPNAAQLDILHREIHFIMVNEFMPPSDWFDARIDKIYAYHSLNWEDLNRKYIHKDSYIHHTSLQIQQMLRRLMDEWAGHSQFDLPTYQVVIDYIQCIWKYYSAVYLMEDSEEDMEDEDSVSNIEQDVEMLRIMERMRQL